jgi:translation elongation factor EF-4
VIVNFSGQLKALTRGYGSVDFEMSGYERAAIEKVVIHIMGDPIDALSFMVHRDRAFEFSKRLCGKLKEGIPQQLFTVSIQAKMGSKVIAK